MELSLLWSTKLLTKFWSQIAAEIWCYIEVGHVLDIFQSLGYDSIPLLGLSPQNSMGFDMNFGRLVEHKHR